MKKIIAVLAAAFMFGVSAFAEGYLSANDLSVGEITNDASQEDGFIIHGSQKKIKVVKNSTKAGEEKFTQRMELGGSRIDAGGTPVSYISFPVQKGETLTVWGKSSSKKDDRVAEIYDADKNVIGSIPMKADGGLPKDYVASWKIPVSGEISLGSKGSTIYIYKIEVTK